MPLTRLITEKKLAIEGALDSGRVTTLYIGVDPEVQPLLIKLLSAVDASPRSSDVFIPLEHPYAGVDAWFGEAHQALVTAVGSVRDALQGEGLPLDVPPMATGLRPEMAFLQSASALSYAIKRRASHLVLVVLARDALADPRFTDALSQMGRAADPRRLKVVVLGPRGASPLGGWGKDEERLSELELHVSPEAIEGGVREKLEDPKLGPLEHLRYVSALASFASARRETDRALALSRQAVDEARRLADPRELVAAVFCLGNTLVRAEDWQGARVQYELAVQEGLPLKMHSLVIQALTQVGLTWLHTGPTEHAIAYLEGARRLAHAVEDPISEAYVLTHKGDAQRHAQDPTSACATWGEARALYEAMPPHLEQVAKAGLSELDERLDEAGDQTTGPHGHGSGARDGAADAGRACHGR